MTRIRYTKLGADSLVSGKFLGTNGDTYQIQINEVTKTVFLFQNELLVQQGTSRKLQESFKIAKEILKAVGIKFEPEVRKRKEKNA